MAGCPIATPPLPPHPLRLPALRPASSCTRLVPFPPHPLVQIRSLWDSVCWRAHPAGRGHPVPGPAVPSQRLLRRSTHLTFLPSGQRSRAVALCHSALIHLSSLVRFTLSMARSISSCHAATPSHCSILIFIISCLDPLAQALMLPDNDPIAPRAAKTLLRRLHGSTAPPTYVHLHHLQPARRRAQSVRLLSSPPTCLHHHLFLNTVGTRSVPEALFDWGEGRGVGSQRRYVHNDGHS